jgi:peptide chain release factor subunit 1
VFNPLPEKDSLAKFKLKRTLSILAAKEGRHTELVSLYVPPDRQISDVMNSLRQELGTASNIKSKSTRKNVQEAIEKVMQKLKLFNVPPPNGLVIFAGAIPQNGVGSEKTETYVIVPPKIISIYYYRCDSKFHIEPLVDMLREKDTYGIILIDGNNTSFATLKGRTLDIIKEISSGLHGKHGRGGQSQRRFERLRETQVNDYYKRVGRYANEIFLQIPDLTGIIIGGPGPTKRDFEEGEFLHYTLKTKIRTIVDTAYVGKQGVEEIVQRADKVLSEIRYVEEKRIVQKFLYEIGHDTGLATYGEEDVRRAVTKSAIKTLLLSEELEATRITTECENCGYIEVRTIKRNDTVTPEQEVEGQICPKCSNPNLTISSKKDLIDELAEITEQTGGRVEIISTRTEEGVGLIKSFGGVAAILRFKQH